MNFAETVINTFVDRKLAQPHSTAVSLHPDDRSLTKGLIAGLVAGVAATGAKVLVERVYPPRIHREPNPAAKLAEEVADHRLTPANEKVATEAIHWGFGAVVGAAYGGVAEFYPAATSREGVSFGMALMAVTHESALPAMGLAASPVAQSGREKTSEMASHIVFGLVAEITRRLVRKML